MMGHFKLKHWNLETRLSKHVANHAAFNSLHLFSVHWLKSIKIQAIQTKCSTSWVVLMFWGETNCTKSSQNHKQQYKYYNITLVLFVPPPSSGLSLKISKWVFTNWHRYQSSNATRYDMYTVIDQSDVQHVILDFVFAWVVCICGPWDKSMIWMRNTTSNAIYLCCRVLRLLILLVSFLLNARHTTTETRSPFSKPKLIMTICVYNKQLHWPL
jgi:hypothetical protein